MTRFNAAVSLSALALLAGGSAWAQPVPLFETEPQYAVAHGPGSVAIGDLDGDGRPDLVAGCNGALSVLLGNGDGTFQAAVDSPIDGSDSVALGDLDGDGYLDVVTVRSSIDGVSVLLGNGDGSFQTAVDYPMSAGPRSVAVGDFNGDGKADVVAASNNVGLHVLLGNGNGTFQTAVDYDLGTGSRSLAVGDVNGDARPDLAVVGSGVVRVLLGNGDGSFQSPVSYSAGTNPSFISAADLNGDGRADLVVSGSSGPGGTISVLLANGSGGFQVPLSYPVGTSPRSAAIGDLNGDGGLDLAIPDNGANDLRLLFGDGNGGFPTSANFAVGIAPVLASVGDLNHDGRVDLAVANLVSDNVSVLLSNAAGSLEGVVRYAVGALPESVAVGEFNGDGRADLVVANQNTNDLSVLLGSAPGAFGTAVNYPAGSSVPWSVVVADFNADGLADLSVGRGVNVLLGIGNGTFQAATNYFANAGLPALGDFNRDGKVDLAVTSSLLSSGRVSVLLGNGDGSFQGPVAHAVGAFPWGLAVGEFNGDGRADLVVANNGSATVSVLLGNGDGTFQTAVNHSAGSAPEAVALGDFNGDGNTDLAVANFNSNNVSLLLGNGDGSFQTAVNYGAGSRPFSIAAADWNGDGQADLAVGNQNGDNLSLLLGNGDGTLQSAVSHPVGDNPWALAVGDFNADGRPDLAVANQRSNSLSVLLGKAGARVSTSTTLLSSPNPSAIGEAVTFTAVVKAAAGVPTGAVTFYDGATSLGTAPVIGGLAVVTTSALSGGTHSITAAYGGDALSVGSASSALSHEVVNTPLGTEVTVQPVDPATGTSPVTLTFAEVTTAGDTVVAISSSGPPPSAGFVLGNPPTYYELTTTAAFVPPITVCIDYSSTSFGDESQLVLLHYENGGWENRTSSLDTNANVICAVVSSLSPFAVFERQTSSADIGVSNTASPSPVVVYGSVAYTVTVTNHGPSAATGATMTTLLPAGMSFVSAMPGQGSCAGGATVTCSLGNLAAGVSSTITIAVTPATAGIFSLTAEAGASETDPNSANNSATATIAVNASADLSLTNTYSPNPVSMGGNLISALTVTNIGPSPAMGVALTDTLPAGVSFVSAVASQGTCSGATTVTCALGMLAASGSATVTIVVTAGTPGVLSNTASIGSSVPDPNTSNNSATATTIVNATLASNKDSFLRSGSDDTNEGANERLRIQSSGSNRVVVAFDLAGISAAGLQSATLVLTIAENSNNWSPNGRLVDAHRLLVSWSEGNGRNDVMAGGGPGFRGTGEGVTWRCAKDADIADQGPDCSTFWNGGSLAPATAPAVLHTNGLLGVVSWNVTADVVAGADFGWVLKKPQEGQAGQVRYYSREGAALVGNPTLAPRLVLVYAP